VSVNSSSKRPLPALILVAYLALSLSARADERRPPDPGIIDQVWHLVQQHFYRHKPAQGRWPALRDKYRREAAKASNQQEVHGLVLRMIAELRASHATLFDGEVYREHIEAELKNTLVPSFGLDLVALPEGVFVSAIADGGVAEAAGLRRGDRILAIDEAAPLESPRLKAAGSDAAAAGPVGYFIRARRPLNLTLERWPDRGPKGVFQRHLKPLPGNLVAATRRSIRVIERGPARLGVIHLWHLAHHRVVGLLKQAMTGEFASCDGIVLDLRGRGGTPDAVTETLELFEPEAASGPRWTKPVVALIDSGTRSAKEVLAFQLRARKIALIVGVQSAGAVLGARMFPLRDGAYLMLPTVDVRALTGGANLEGKGVKPDIAVKAPLPWMNGKDPIFERGIDELFWAVRKRQRFGKKHRWY